MMNMTINKKAGALMLCLYLLCAGYAQSTFNVYEFYSTKGIKYDTINKNDSTGQANNHWIIINKDRRPKLPGYTDIQIIEEGRYVHGKKSGLWNTYYPEGNKKEETTFMNGKPHGPAVKYYANGHLQEKRNWNGAKVTGELILYDEKGNITDLSVYDNSGKRIKSEYFKDGFKYMENKKENDSTEIITEFDKTGKVMKKYSERAGEKSKGKF
jgi:hypothetical protein